MLKRRRRGKVLLHAIVVFLLLCASACSSFLVEEKRYIRYPVKSGDTLAEISLRFGVSSPELVRLNGLRSARSLQAGTYLKVPYLGQSLAMNREDFEARARMSRHAFSRDTRFRDVGGKQARSKPPQGTAPRSDSTIPRNIPGNSASQKGVAFVTLGPAAYFVKRLRWPVDKKGSALRSTFGRRWLSFHEGVDFGVPIGTPVYAAYDGVVVYSGSGLRGYGNLIVLRHYARSGAKLVTVYAHNDRNRVRVGERVRRGQRIADSGNTGKSSGPHLHFETRRYTSKGQLQAVDPLKFY